MTMLYPREFWAIHGPGAKVYDATGRQLRSVIACNLETGEVITYDMPLVAHAWHQLLWPKMGPRWPFRWRFGPYLHPPGSGCLDRRHGFWPAPLRVVPKLSWDEIKDRIASGSGGRKALSISDLDELVDAMEGNGRRQSLAELADTSSTLPATPDEHGQLRDTIAARRQAGGPVPPGQPYIVGNGDREGFYRS